MSEADDDLATFAEFAEIARVRRSYVTQLKQDDRLVLSDDGKRVRVKASLQLIEDTRDPSKAGVRARHQVERERVTEPRVENVPADSRGDPIRDDDDEEPAGWQGASFPAARAVRERYLAAAAKRDYDLSMGKLLDAAATLEAVAGAITMLRSRLSQIGATHAAELAIATDEGACQTIVEDAFEHAMSECERELLKVAQGKGAANE